MGQEITILEPIAAGSALAQITAQADSDAGLIRLWLHGRSPHTVRAYRADVAGFLAFTGRTLRQTSIGDIQAFGDSLVHLSAAAQGRRLSAVKSLIAYAHRLGYLPFDVGAPVRLPSAKNTLAERIIDEAAVHQLINAVQGRDRLILRLLYAAGLRISELCALTWRDAQANGDAGQLTLFGKGGKTRVVLLSAATWRELVLARGDVGEMAPMFVSQRRGHLDPSQVHRIVKAAAAAAGISPSLSAHWLRHAHASHALDRAAPIHLVQATLGHASVATTGRYLHARPTDSSARYLGV